MAGPKFKSLKAWAEELGIPVSTLRAEITDGRLGSIRARPSCNSPILVSEAEMTRWLEEHAGKRQRVLSPTEAARVNADVLAVHKDSKSEFQPPPAGGGAVETAQQ